MNKFNSPSSYSSSETSETQSVEENQLNDSNTTQSSSQNFGTTSRIPKSWKRMKDPNNDKDAESKRPPWRAVSISTLPKPDKNAILRAKLLDASRRLRASKLAVGVQTDTVPTVIMKDVGIGAQTDLILYKEIGLLTDGFYSKRRDGTEEFVLTYSVSLMTDCEETVDVSTQTLLPKIPGDAFLEAYSTNQTNNKMLLNRCSSGEKKLLQQLEKLRETREKTFGLSEECNSKSEQKTPHSTLIPRKPTKFYWRFEDDIDEKGKFKSYTINAYKPWNSFVPFSSYKNQCVELDLLLVAIDELIRESNHLADMVEDLMRRQRKRHDLDLFGPPVNNITADDFKPIEHKMSSDYWLPIIEEQEKQLAELNSFKPINIASLETYIKESKIMD
uniref:Uncharacterized protein n=1 Tax=Glossina brevipalpis TaxID=37001 RepID=A0A1A9WV76_9MUSC